MVLGRKHSGQLILNLKWKLENSAKLMNQTYPRQGSWGIYTPTLVRNWLKAAWRVGEAQKYNFQVLLS